MMYVIMYDQSGISDFKVNTLWFDRYSNANAPVEGACISVTVTVDNY